MENEIGSDDGMVPRMENGIRTDDVIVTKNGMEGDDGIMMEIENGITVSNLNI